MSCGTTMLEGDSSELQEAVKATLSDPAYTVRRSMADMPAHIVKSSSPTMKACPHLSLHDPTFAAICKQSCPLLCLRTEDILCCSCGI